MKKSFIFLVLFSFSLGIYAQVDSLALEELSWEELINLLQEMNESDRIYEGKEVFEFAKNYAKDHFGIKSIQYSSVLALGGDIYFMLNNFQKAEEFLLQCLEVRNEILPEHDSLRIEAVSVLGFFYVHGGMPIKAKEFLYKAKELHENFVAEKNSEYAKILKHLGDVYEMLEKFELSEKYLLEALSVHSLFSDKKNMNYAIILGSLNILYSKIGLFEKAEKCLSEAKEIVKREKGTYSVDYSEVLTQYGTLNLHLNQNKKAEKFYLEAKAITDSLFRQSHFNCARARYKLADLYRGWGKYNQSIVLFLEVLEIFDKCELPDSSFFIYPLINLGSAYANLLDFDKSKFYMEKGLKLAKEYIDTTSIVYAEILDTYSVHFLYQNNFEAHKHFGEQVLKILSERLNPYHEDYYMILSKLASTYWNLNQLEKADSFFLKSEMIFGKLIENYYPLLGEGGRLNFLRSFKWPGNRYYSFLSNRKNSNPNIVKDGFERILQSKNLAFEISLEARFSIHEKTDISLRKTFQEWQITKRQIQDILLYKLEDSLMLDSLYERVNLAEKKLSSAIKKVDFTKNKNQSVDLSLLKRTLKADEAAIEIIKFQYAKNNRTDSILYYAFLIRPNDINPKMIFLGEESNLQPFFPISFSQSVSSYYKNHVNGYKLSQSIWKPLEPYLKGVKTIHLSSAGLLYQVSFAALPLNKKGQKVLADKYNFVYHSVLRDFVLKSPTQSTKNKEIVLLGSPNFDFPPKKIPQVVEDIKDRSFIGNQEETLLSFVDSKKRLAAPPDSLRFGNHFSYLAGAQKEIEMIAPRFSKNNWQVRKFIGKEALEDVLSFFEGNNAPRILHIPTHGFFYNLYETPSRKNPSNFKERLVYAKDPLIRSGLVFSGVNPVWNGESPAENVEDGILTALEIANLDLFNTELVVLSACETGLGDVHDGEGVFGLQRAFKLAGVQNLILSLWKVPDQATSELMDYFYKYYLQGKTIREAFHKAQKKMKRKYNSPENWAGFILME